MKIKRLTIPMNYTPEFHRVTNLMEIPQPIPVVAWVHCFGDRDMLSAERLLLETGEIVRSDEGTLS